MAFLLLSVRFRIRAGHFIQMSLTSQTVIPSFSERIIKPFAWGFKSLTISSRCVSFSNVAETGNCQGKTIRSDPIFLYLFICLSPDISHLPRSSQLLLLREQRKVGQADTGTPTTGQQAISVQYLRKSKAQPKKTQACLHRLLNHSDLPSPEEHD